MPVSPARESAIKILQQVERGRGYAAELLQARRISSLSEADRRLTTEIVMGVLRRRGDLDHQIEKLSGKPAAYFDAEVLEILRTGVYQIRYLATIPKYAAVNESVELVKKARKASAAGLVNAVLRKCAPGPFGVGESEAAAAQGIVDAARRSLPGWLLERWERNFGEDAAASLAIASSSAPRVWLRLTGVHFERDAVRRELEAAGIRTQPGAYGARALWVESGSATSAQAWRAGRVMIQDEASQLVGELAGPEHGQCALDLCAAPGMKALQIAESIAAGTFVACDRSMSRMRILDKVVGSAWPAGVARHRVLLDATEPLPFSKCFDRILADVPCSGTGTLARNPEIKWRLQPEDLPRLAAEQVRILCRGLDALAPRGRLVYSTCSLEPEENERVVSKALHASHGSRQLRGDELRREFPHLGPLIGDDGALRTLPGRNPCDGFFAAVIVRK